MLYYNGKKIAEIPIQGVYTKKVMHLDKVVYQKGGSTDPYLRVSPTETLWLLDFPLTYNVYSNTDWIVR